MLFLFFTLQISIAVDRRPNVSVTENVRSSTSVDLNTSLDPVRVVMTTDKESEEDKLR